MWHKPFMSISTPTRSERRSAILIHLGGYFGYILPILGLIVPLWIWLARGEKSKYVEAQGREWANFSIFTFLAMILLSAVGMLLFFSVVMWLGPHAEPAGSTVTILTLVFGLPALLFLGFVLSQPMLAAYRCSRGENFRYPLPFRILKNDR